MSKWHDDWHEAHERFHAEKRRFHAERRRIYTTLRGNREAWKDFASHKKKWWPWWLQARLQRRLFGWFGVVLGVGLVVGWRFQLGGPRWWQLVIAFVVLWGSSGAIAWRLSRPLLMVVKAARDIGAGKLDTRISVGPRHDELRLLADAINDMAERIETQIKDQRSLLAAVSHELRTPLGHMRVLIDTARDGHALRQATPPGGARRDPLDPTAPPFGGASRGAHPALDPTAPPFGGASRGAHPALDPTAPPFGGASRGAHPALDELEREVIVLDDLVGKLLASSRLEFGNLDRRPLDLGELVTDVATCAGVPPEAISAEGDVRANIDPTLVRRALANLLDNARTHGGGVLAVRIVRRAGQVAIEVDDAGPGVPADRRADAFRAFVPSAGGGLGLGLALVSRIAVAHGGGAWIQDRPGGGATVGFAVSI